MELSTIEEAQGVFGYLESRIKKLRQVLHPSFRESSPLLHTLCSSMMPYWLVLRVGPCSAVAGMADLTFPGQHVTA